MLFAIGGCSWLPSGDALNSLEVQMLDMHHDFTLTTNFQPTTDEEQDCTSHEALELTFQHKKYGTFTIRTADIALDYCDGTVALTDIVNKGYHFGTGLYIPVVNGRAAHLLTYDTWIYDLTTKAIKKTDSNCLPLREPELLSGGIIKGISMREDWNEVFGSSYRESPVYCDLAQNKSYSELGYISAQLSDAVEKQMREEEFIKTYYRMMQEHEFDELFAVTLWKGESKAENPFPSWYSDVQEVDVQAITPQ